MNFDLIELSPAFTDEDQAHALVEHLRWPHGPRCAHCGSERVYRLNVNGARRKVLKCAVCRKQFSVMVGTIFEDSHVPLGKWLAAIYLMCSSKKGISALQLQRSLGVTYKTAWFMCHRIREAMKEPPLADKLQGIVETDETYVGGKERGKRGRPGRDSNKVPVVTMVERQGRARSEVVTDVRGSTLKGLIGRNVLDTAHIMTDSFKSYRGLDAKFARHDVIDHSREYVRGIVHTNFAESFFSLLKRGILGTFHHVSERHLPRYMSEFDFRWNRRGLSDGERTAEAIKATEGKRLTLRAARRGLN